MGKEGEFRSRWEDALQIVFQHEAMAGHDNKSAVLTNMGIELFPDRLRWLNNYKSKDGNFSWHSIESHIIKLIQQESRCTICQFCPIKEGFQSVDGVLFSTNTNMVISKTIDIREIDPDAPSRSIVANEDFPTPNGLPFFDLFIGNTGFGAINSTLDLENYESETTMAEKGASMIEAYPFAKRPEIIESSATLSATLSATSSASSGASSSDDEEDISKQEQSLQTNLCIGLTLQRNSYHDRIREWMGNINQIDCASRTNHPRAIYSSGRLTIPIRIPIGDNILTLSINYNVGQDVTDNFYRVESHTKAEKSTTLRITLTNAGSDTDIFTLLNFINENYPGNRTDLLKNVKGELETTFSDRKARAKILSNINDTSFTVAPKPVDFINYMLLLNKLYKSYPDVIKEILYKIIKDIFSIYVPSVQPGYEWNKRFAWLITENKMFVGRAIINLFSSSHKLEADPELKATILGTSQKAVSSNTFWNCPSELTLAAGVATTFQGIVNRETDKYFYGKLQRMPDGSVILKDAQPAHVVDAFAKLSDIERFTTAVVANAPSCPIGFGNIMAVPTVNTSAKETAVLQTGFKYGLNVLADAAEFAADDAAFDASILVANATDVGVDNLKANSATDISEDSSLGKGMKRKREECEPVVSHDQNVEDMRLELKQIQKQINESQVEYDLQFSFGVLVEDLELITKRINELTITKIQLLEKII